MAKLRSINTKFWSDDFIIDLDPLDRYFYLYLLTNEHTNISGVYELPKKVMIRETNLDRDTLEKCIDKLKDRVYYILGWVVIKNFIKNQSLNPKVKIGIKKSLDEVPSNIWLKIQEIDSLYIGYDNFNLNLNLNLNNISNKIDYDSLLTNYAKKTDRSLTDKIKKYLKEVDIKSPNQIIVEYYKLLKGYFTIDDWNKSNFTRHQRPAKILYNMFSNVEQVFRAMDIVSIWAEKEGLSWTMETIAKKWPDFQLGKLNINKKPIPQDVIIWGGEFHEKGNPTDFDNDGLPTKFGLKKMNFC